MRRRSAHMSSPARAAYLSGSPSARSRACSRACRSLWAMLPFCRTVQGMEPVADLLEQRVLIHAPLRRDGPTVGAILGAAGMETVVCPSMQDLADEFRKGIGAALIAEEALAT